MNEPDEQRQQPFRHPTTITRPASEAAWNVYRCYLARTPLKSDLIDDLMIGLEVAARDEGDDGSRVTLEDFIVSEGYDLEDFDLV